MAAKHEYLVESIDVPCGKHGVRGFTMIELVMVIVLIGILSAAALPRLSNSGLDEHLFLNQTTAALRFAQKTAIAAHRTVCVSFSANQVAFQISDTYGAANCTPGSALNGPEGGPLLVQAKGSAVFSPVPTDFVFDAKGGVASTQTVTVSGMGTLTVEAETGYVH